MTAVHRYEIPVDDQTHQISLTGDVLHVATRRVDVVEVWALAGSRPPQTHHVRVVGTGHRLTAGAGRLAAYWGTAIVPGGALVWHLFEVQP
jgi:hypothetical protein